MNDIFRNIRRGERRECWCGAELLPFTHHPSYGVCVNCGCYVNRYPPLDLQALYASDLYWHFLQQQYGYPPIESRGELYKRDGRLGYWLNLIEHYGPPSGTVIEVGCAPGVLLAELQQRGYRCIGVEPDAKTADWVRQNFTVDVLAGLFPGISLPSCHLFLAFDVLEHSPSPDLFMREVARLLDQRGVAIIQTPVERYGFDPPFGEAFRNAFKEIEHLFLFTNRALTVMAERSGLEIVTMSERLWLHHEICILRKPARDSAKALDPFCAVKSLPYRVVNELGEDKPLSLQGEPSTQPDFGRMESAARNEELAGGPAVLGKAAGARHLVIDGVIFQLQGGRPLGISRVWRSLVRELAVSLPSTSITVLRRRGFPTELSGISEYEIEPYKLGAASILDADDSMLANICKKLDADIFISTYYTRAPGVRNVLVIHDMIPEIMGFDLSKPEWLSKQRAISHAYSYIAVSHSTRRDLIRLAGIHGDRVRVAYNGVSANFRPAKKELIERFMRHHDVRLPYLLLVGNRSQYKSCGTFFQALASLPERSQMQVFAVGGEPCLLPEEACYSNEGRIGFCDWLPESELAAAYSGALALVYPSRYEGFGLPILEAMACGCPVITGRNSSLTEVGGDAVLYVNPDSVDEIAGAIREVLQPDVRAQLATRGIEQASHFSWSAMAQIVAEAILDEPTCSVIEPQSVVGDVPLVSAIVSVYNAERFIRGCLDDLEQQTIADRLEIVVINTGSPQGEDAIIREYMTRYKNIVYIKADQRETIYSAWNRGIKAARGKYITNANTDDRHRCDAFEVLTRTLDEHPDVTLVYADCLITHTENETFEAAHPVGIFKWPEYDRQALFNRCFIGPQPMWRKEVHEEYGYFDESFVSAGDYEFWLRISRTRNFLHVHDTLGVYLLSSSGVEHGNQALSARESMHARLRHSVSGGSGSPAAGLERPEEVVALGVCRVAGTERTTTAESLSSKSPETDGPMVSVIVPTYNRPETLIVALQSILSQTFQDIEVIVVNDAGSDVENIVRFLDRDGKITYIRHGSNRDRAAARNTAMKIARGKYIAYLDDDDLFYPDHLETLVTYLEQNESKVAYSDAYRAHQEKRDGRYVVTKREVAHSLDFDGDRILVHNFIPILCIVHERACLDAVGLFDEALTTHEDWELWIRMSRRFPFAHIKKVTCEFVSRTDGSTTTSSKLLDFKRTMAIVLERHKASVSEKPHVRAAQEKILLRLKGQTTEGNGAVRSAWSQRVAALLQQADAYCKTGDLQEAKKTLEQAIEILPDDPQLVVTLGNVILRLGDVEGARCEFVKATVLRPDCAPAHADLAAVHLYLGRAEDAEVSARRALELDPANIPALKVLAKICLDTERYQEAVQAYVTILQHAPNDIETLLLVGNCYAEVGRFAQARPFYKKVLALDPGNQIAVDNLAEIDRLAAVTAQKNPLPSPSSHQEGARGEGYQERYPLPQTGGDDAGDEVQGADLRVHGCVTAVIPAKVGTEAVKGCRPEVCPSASIVVVTYNSAATIRACLDSILSESTLQTEVVVVDNASIDTTRAILKDYQDRITVIVNTGNRGFSAACNQGIRASSGEYVILLNPDAIVTAGWLERMIAYCGPGVGAVGPVSDHAAGEQNIDRHLPDGAPKHMGLLEVTDLLGQANLGKPREAKLLTGFCLMVPRKVFDDVGLLDEDLFLGNDDLDLSWRLRLKGYKLLVATDTFVHHKGQISFKSEPEAKTSRLIRASTDRLYAKLEAHYGPGNVPDPIELWGINWFTPTNTSTVQHPKSDAPLTPHPSPLTSIIILTCNGLLHTKRCLESIDAYTPEPHELIIVDNGSTDGTLDYLYDYAKAFEHVRIIANQENRGFAAGNNQGLALARGDCLVLLNNDTVVTAGWLGKMLAVFDRHPGVGIVGPVSNYVSGPQLIKEVRYASLAEMQRFATRWATEHKGQSRPITRVVGFCLLVRKQVIDRIGGLDERFGSGNFEDDDFCIRAVQVGFTARIADDVFVHHTGSQTFKAAGIDYRKSMERNWELFKAKWGIPIDASLEQGYRLPVRPLDEAELVIPLRHMGDRPDAEVNGRRLDGAARDRDADGQVVDGDQGIGRRAVCLHRWETAVSHHLSVVNHGQSGDVSEGLIAESR